MARLWNAERETQCEGSIPYTLIVGQVLFSRGLTTNVGNIGTFVTRQRRLIGYTVIIGVLGLTLESSGYRILH